ncbi:hypothetical protein X760_05875 [Mesorhizobium sp. LSHC422A00]|nr:hypothetical protein X760_05875 [Mesorhizobium sp. LSHC422A00]
MNCGALVGFAGNGYRSAEQALTQVQDNFAPHEPKRFVRPQFGGCASQICQTHREIVRQGMRFFCQCIKTKLGKHRKGMSARCIFLRISEFNSLERSFGVFMIPIGKSG